MEPKRSFLFKFTAIFAHTLFLHGEIIHSILVNKMSMWAKPQANTLPA